MTDDDSLTLYAFEKAILSYPATDAAVVNYTRTIHDYIESIAIAKTELLFSSNAVSSGGPRRSPPRPSSTRRRGGGGGSSTAGASGAAGA